MEQPIRKEPKHHRLHTRYQHFGSVYSLSLTPVQTPVSLETHLPPLERNGLHRLRLTRVTGTDQDSGFAASSCFELRTARDGFVERMRKTSEQQIVAMTQKPALTARNSVYALILNVSAISFCSASGSLYRLEM
jgi:hypothetical protein